jgi:chitinase
MLSRASVVLATLLLHWLTPRAAVSKSIPFQVAAYVPEYRLGHVHDHSSFVLPLVTDLLLFSIEPSADGLGLAATDRVLWDGRVPERFQRPARGPARVSVSVGGAGRSHHFAAVASSEARTVEFARRLQQFLVQHDLDGVDVDWEAQVDARTLEQFLRGLAGVLRSGDGDGGRGVSSAASSPNINATSFRLTVALHHFALLPRSAYAFVDAVHLMAYDLSSGPEGHSSLAHSQQTVQMLLNAGCPRHKVLLGVPAYSRRVGNPGDVRTYSELVAQEPANAARDASPDGHAYNGVELVRAKTRWARAAGLGGVMLWEAGQDTVDAATSLLASIRAESLGAEVVVVEEEGGGGGGGGDGGGGGGGGGGGSGGATDGAAAARGSASSKKKKRKRQTSGEL